MKYLFAKRIIDASNFADKEKLLHEDPLQKDSLQVCIGYQNTITLHDHDYFILDFGKEISGGIRLLTSYVDANHKIRLRFGESISEVNSDIGPESGATNDHSPRDFEVFVSHLSDLTFGQTGFRFIRIDFEGSFWIIQHVVAAIDIDEREEIGKFESDDKLLNDIWNTASYTLRLNLHNGVIWDGIKRDRLCWIGDCYNEIYAMMCLYNKQDEIANILDFTIPNVEFFFKEKESIIPSTYPLWWILILNLKYEHDYDQEYFINHKSFALKIIKKTISYIDDEGNLLLPNNFVDWPTHPLNDNTPEDDIKRHDEAIGVKALALWTFKSFLNILHSLNDYSSDGLIIPNINKLEKSTYDVKKFKQCAALASFANKNTEHNKKIIKDGGAHGLSTFQSFIILSALGDEGEYDLAFNILKEYYGSMLSLGATTFFEDYDIDWAKGAGRIDEILKPGEIDFHATYGQFCYQKLRHSLCHGWSVGVIPYIVKYVIGLRQIGDNKFVIEPHLSTLKHIKYTYPSLKGPINIQIDASRKGYDIKIDKPDDIEIEIR